jgi:hypothetical protein
VVARLPEQPTDPERLETAFRAFGLPDRLSEDQT